MIHGMDTGFLVSAELVEHPDHIAARATLSRLLGNGDRVALAPQVLAEFIHIVTDSHRFRQPVEISGARRIARKWTAREVAPYFRPWRRRCNSWIGWNTFSSAESVCSIRYWRQPIVKAAFARSSPRIRMIVARSIASYDRR